MSQHTIDSLLDFQNEQKELIGELKRQLSAAKGEQTKLRNKLAKNTLTQDN